MSDTVETLVLVLGEDPPVRIDKALAGVVPEGVSLSRSRIVRLIETGAVSRVADGEPVTRLKTRGLPNEAWRVAIPVAVSLEAEPEDIPIEIVFEDENLIVVNKAAGMVVHPAPGSQTGTLVNALLHHCAQSLSGIGGAKRPGIVHRIDKDTSGLLVVAKTDAAHQGLAVQFADHSIDRRYVAFCVGVPSVANPRLRGLPGVGFEPGAVVRVATNIERHRTDRKRMAICANSGRHAITRIRAVKEFANRAARLECWLETGRTHQIRVHLSHLGHGLLGDPVYGTGRKLGLAGLEESDGNFLRGFARQALHAAKLGFVHPVTGECMAFEAKLPKDLRTLNCLLGKLKQA